MLLNTADKVYVGTTRADAVYLGSELVWAPAPGGWTPGALSGLVTWLDAEDYTPGTWPNRAEGPEPTVEGPTPMTVSANQQNGMKLVRFTKDQGRLRSVWPHDRWDWTLVYLVRWVGPGMGRAFTTQYPPSNLLVGMHTSGDDQMYANGAFLQGPNVSQWLKTWKMYGADSTVAGQRFFIDGVQIGPLYAGSHSLDGAWGISGYEASSAETLDIEVAELVLFNRKLSDVERQQVEAYLQAKWIIPLASPYDIDTQAYLAATGLNVSYAPALDGLVRGLKTHGLWTKMKAVYPFIGGTADLHKWNLKDPRNLDAAYRLTFRGGAHSQALGYRPNPAITDVTDSGRAETYLVPLGTLAQDSTHLSLYSLENKPVGPRCDMGCYNWDGQFARFHVIAHYIENAFYYGMSERGGSNAPSPAGSGLFVATRLDTYDQRGYRNGLRVGYSGAPSVPLPSIPVHIGEISGYNREYSDLPLGFASIGDGLNDSDNANLYTVVQDYQTALGRQRSPIE